MTDIQSLVPEAVHLETVHFMTPQGAPGRLTVWVTTPDALPGLEGIPHRDTYAATWTGLGQADCEEGVPVRIDCVDKLVGIGVPEDLARDVQGILWTDLDEAQQHWRRKGWSVDTLCFTETTPSMGRTRLAWRPPGSLDAVSSPGLQPQGRLAGHEGASQHWLTATNERVTSPELVRVPAKKNGRADNGLDEIRDAATGACLPWWE